MLCHGPDLSPQPPGPLWPRLWASDPSSSSVSWPLFSSFTFQLPGCEGPPNFTLSWQVTSSPYLTSTPEPEASVSQTSEGEHKAYEKHNLEMWANKCAPRRLSLHFNRNFLTEPVPRGGGDTAKSGVAIIITLGTQENASDICGTYNFKMQNTAYKSLQDKEYARQNTPKFPVITS